MEVAERIGKRAKEFVVDRAFFDQLIPLIRVESGAD